MQIGSRRALFHFSSKNHLFLRKTRNVILLFYLKKNRYTRKFHEFTIKKMTPEVCRKETSLDLRTALTKCKLIKKSE